MSENRKQSTSRDGKLVRSGSRRRVYTKPSFKHEKVFETMALACGKLSATQAQCRFNRKLS